MCPRFELSYIFPSFPFFSLFRERALFPSPSLHLSATCIGTVPNVNYLPVNGCKSPSTRTSASSAPFRIPIPSSPPAFILICLISAITSRPVLLLVCGAQVRPILARAVEQLVGWIVGASLPLAKVFRIQEFVKVGRWPRHPRGLRGREVVIVVSIVGVNIIMIGIWGKRHRG